MARKFLSDADFARSALDRAVRRWQLVLGQESWQTPTSQLHAVEWQGQPAVLKIVRRQSDERQAPRVLRYFAGHGSVRLLASSGCAQLLERLFPGQCLRDMEDDEACRHLVEVVLRLHERRPNPPKLPSLRERFRSLFRLAGEDPLLQRGAQTAEQLLASAGPAIVLHGDIHHLNVIAGVAIDPKGIYGERTYDYANLLGNPSSRSERVLQPGRLERQLGIVARRAELPPRRLLQFVFADACLSTAWCLEDGDPTDHWRAHARQAETLLS